MTRAAEILVVDDEPDLRALIADYLGLQGFAVRTAEDAAALDRRLAEAPADLIVLDINMPGETGLAALARLRAQGCRAGVILLTAAGTLGDRVGGLGQGADDYVVKPFEPRELLARVRAVGQEASLVFSAFDTRTAPEILGQVKAVSADAIEDPVTRMRYYRADIQVDAGMHERLGDLLLLPGMPVEAFIRTTDRSPLSYFAKPLTTYFNRAFRES